MSLLLETRFCQAQCSCPSGARRGEWRDGKKGGRAVIDTDRGESVLVWGHNNSRGTGTTTLALRLAERH